MDVYYCFSSFHLLDYFGGILPFMDLGEIWDLSFTIKSMVHAQLLILPYSEGFGTVIHPGWSPRGQVMGGKIIILQKCPHPILWEM